MPSVTELEAAYVADAVRNGWGEHCYDYLTRFEAAFATRLGVACGLATSSCTGAMHLGLAALGVGPGDEVVVADATWIASIAPAVHLGARPVFVDVDPHTWCIDPDAVEAAIGPRTRAIIAVHLYGNLCDMGRLLALGQRYGIPVIEDAAEAIGSVYHGRPAGSLGRFGVFSFHGTKTMTTGEGGLLVTDDRDLYDRAVLLANHGRQPGRLAEFRPERIGYKFRMANLQAALGLAQLERLDELVAGKRRVFEAYAVRLAGLPLQMNPEPAATVNGYWMPTVILEQQAGASAAQLLSALERQAIDARPFFPPLSSLPMFAPVRANRHSYDLAARGANLPSYHGLGDDAIERVCQTVRGFLEAL
jgi:perosamine synthetase